ncbi:adenosine deaminase [Pararobbsia alpina]|uniref:Adenine deaminase n=1 Tax=Pararobbsia alpina TaxID=621374 RepID=A0A6S7B9C7_9BURK|nr:adenosine deaminase [Pararobbsia alpina]CAB3792212.1 Adenine deaminase [Pararobbsia alpina]
MSLNAFIQSIPKAELHMHLEGAIEPALMLELADRNGVSLPWQSEAQIKEAYRFTDLQSFLDLFYQGCKLLITREDFHDLTRAYYQRAHRDGIVHAEVFLSLQSHLTRGIALDTILDGVLSAIDDAARTDQISGGLLIGIQRHRPEDDAIALLERLHPWRDRIAGFGLGGAERGNPPAKFARFFARCKELGYRTTAHAGEEGPAEYVRDTVHILKVHRIDHGNAAMNDPELVRELAASKIPFTVCPLSNLKLNVVASLESHPLRAMLEAGLHVTVNSDDPAFFGGYLNENLIACADALELDVNHLHRLAHNSLTAAFMPAAQRDSHLRQLDAVTASYRAN